MRKGDSFRVLEVSARSFVRNKGSFSALGVQAETIMKVDCKGCANPWPGLKGNRERKSEPGSTEESQSERFRSALRAALQGPNLETALSGGH